MSRMSADYRREGHGAQGSGGIKGGRVDAGVGNEREDAAEPALNRTSGFPSAVSSLTQDFWLRYTLSSIELEQLSWAF